MKQLCNFIFALILCVPMSMQVAEADSQNSKKTINPEVKADSLSKLAGEMAEISDSLLRAAVKGDTAFYAKEKEYWTRIKEGSETYANAAYSTKLNDFYAASSDYWHSMHDCYKQALVNNPADSLFWNKAVEQTRAMADLFSKLTQDTTTPDATEATATPPNGPSAQAVEQFTIDSDVAAFYERYKTLVDTKEAQSKSQQLYVWVLGGISVLALLALLVSLAVFLVRRLRGRKTRKGEDGYAPVVKVKNDVKVPSNKAKRNHNKSISSGEKSLSQRLIEVGFSDECNSFFLDNTKHYVEQTLTCPTDDYNTYKEQLVDYFCKISGKNNCRDSFKKLVDKPLRKKSEGETVRFVLPAMIDSNLIQGLTQYNVESKEKTIPYAAWPPFPIKDDVTSPDANATNPGEGLSAQVSELSKHIDELRDYLGVKADKKEEQIDETVANDFGDTAESEETPTLESEKNIHTSDVKALAAMFETIEKSVSSLDTQVNDFSEALKTSGADSAELERTKHELKSAKQQLVNADKEREEAVKFAVANIKNKLKRAEEELATAETRRLNDLAKAKKLHQEELKAAEARRLNDLAEAHKESQEYRERLTFYTPMKQLAAQAVRILDANFVAVQTLERLGTLAKPDLVTDDFHYYINRIRDKYARLISDHARNNFVLISELRELAIRGLVPTGGVIDRWLKNTNPNQLVDTLNQNIYNQLLRPYIGATIIMADECAYLLPKMQPGTIPNNAIQQFKDCAKQAKESAESLGYEVVYAKPLDPMNKYKNVVNKEYASDNAPVNSGDIFEVFSMAVNFGSSVDKTQVSAKH